MMCDKRHKDVKKKVAANGLQKVYSIKAETRRLALCGLSWEQIHQAAQTFTDLHHVLIWGLQVKFSK